MINAVAKGYSSSVKRSPFHAAAEQGQPAAGLRRVQCAQASGMQGESVGDDQ